MKKFFLIAAAAVVAFASCSKNETAPVQDRAIGFNTYTGRSVTKANVTNFIPKSQTWLTAQPFGVYAYNSKDADFAQANIANYAKFFTNQKVTFTGLEADKTNEKKYDYSPLRYWPNDKANNKLTFWAYYPYKALTKGFEANDYAITATTPDAMDDLLVADIVANQAYDSHNGVVPFVFHHALTMVKFFVIAEEDYGTDVTITLNSITLKGVKKAGTITPTYASNATSFAWTATGDDATFAVCDTDAEIDDAGSFFPVYTSDAENKAAYLMIPQALTNAKVDIQYTVSMTGSDDVVNTVTDLPLTTTAVPSWDMNKNIKYTFTIGLKPIRFTASVEPWENEVEVPFTSPFTI